MHVLTSFQRQADTVVNDKISALLKVLLNLQQLFVIMYFLNQRLLTIQLLLCGGQQSF